LNTSAATPGGYSRKDIRIGLVLGGGGGKGAYQVGVYRFIYEYLSQRGLGTFEAISGTSVGALNAMLFATANASEALEIWRTMADFLKASRKRPEIIVAHATVLLLTVLPVATLIGSLVVYALSHRLIALGIAAFLFALTLVGSAIVEESLSMPFFYFAKFVELSPLNGLIKFFLRKFNSIVIGSLLWIAPLLSFVGVVFVTAYCWPFGPEPFFKETWIRFPKLIANIAVWLSIFAASIALWMWIEKHRQAAIEKTRDFGWYDTSPLLN
jgi:hypothetical protein